MILKRKKTQAREGFEIVGITANEITFTDWETLHQRRFTDENALADPDWMVPFDEILNEGELIEDKRIDTNPIMTALDSLPPRWKQAVELHVEKVTQEKAAEIMGVTQPRYFEILRGKDGQSGALGRLRDLLSDAGYVPRLRGVR